jgi:hypothetical protein
MRGQGQVVWSLGHGTDLHSIEDVKFTPATPFNRMLKSNEFPRYKSRRNWSQMIHHMSCTKRSTYIDSHHSHVHTLRNMSPLLSNVTEKAEWDVPIQHAVNTGKMCTYCAARLHSWISHSVHVRFFAATADYTLAVPQTERNATFSHFTHNLVQSESALHKHKTFVLSHVLRPYHCRNLDVAWRMYNYRFTRTRGMVACAIGILCNKWRIFNRAIDVYPDFCNVIVKTCCILHNFICQRDGF